MTSPRMKSLNLFDHDLVQFQCPTETCAKAPITGMEDRRQTRSTSLSTIKTPTITQSTPTLLSSWPLPFRKNAILQNDSGYFTPSPNALLADNSGTGGSSTSSLKNEQGSLPTATYLGLTPSLPTPRSRIGSLTNDTALKPLTRNTTGAQISKNTLPSFLSSTSGSRLDRLGTLRSGALRGGKFKTRHGPHEADQEHSVPLAVVRPGGAKYIDFMVQLTQRNLKHVTCGIMDKMEPRDLGAMSCVSRKWRKVCFSDSVHNKRRKEFVEQMRREKENANHLKAARTLVPRSPFKIVREKTNEIAPNLVTTASHPTVIGDVKFQRVLEVLSTLAPGDRLSKCPRCASPARVFCQPKHAVCSLQSCGFDYCTDCRCDFSNHRPCSPYKPRMPPTVPNAISLKRNRRRLLV